MAIYDQHHKENPMVMELTQDAQALYEGEYTAVIATLNSNWAECVPYDNSFAKVRLWLRVAAVLAVLYANITAKLEPDSTTPITNKITKENLKHAMNLVKYYMDQKAILVKVT